MQELTRELLRLKANTKGFIRILLIRCISQNLRPKKESEKKVKKPETKKYSDMEQAENLD